jgi:hypothetical protein
MVTSTQETAIVSGGKPDPAPDPSSDAKELTETGTGTFILMVGTYICIFFFKDLLFILG